VNEAMTLLCPCGKAKSFDKCCGRFLSGDGNAKTPEQLMRSRYTAYALGNYGDYLLKTWHPAMIAGLTPESLSKKINNWFKLEIISKSQAGNEGVIEFKAFFKNVEDRQEFIYEKSYFQRIAGRWLYVGAAQE
jgi:SEC-C motif-containing protein